MTAVPGSVPWLMRHELRLLYRDWAGQRLTAIALALAIAMLHVAGVVFALDERVVTRVPTVLPLLVVTLALLFVVPAMVARAFLMAVQSLYERRDIDLLLSSPLRFETIFAARASVIALASTADFGLFVLPFANVFVLFGDPRWLMAHLALPLLGSFATSIALWSALWLFKLVGVRRTRAFAQIAARLAPLGFALGLQAVIIAGLSFEQEHGVSPVTAAARSSGLPGDDSALWVPARAVMGAPLWSPIAVLLCAGMFVATVRRLAPEFGDAAARTSSVIASSRRDDRAPPRLRTYRLLALVRKDLRVALRDPRLWGQLVAQLALLVIGTIVSARLAWRGVPIAWLMMVPSAGALAAAIAQWIAANEDAPELLSSAPISALHLVSSQLLASLAPSLLGTLVCAGLLAIEHPGVAGWLAFCSLGHALSHVLPYLRIRRRRVRLRFDLRILLDLPIGFVQFVGIAFWTVVAAIGLFVWA